MSSFQKLAQEASLAMTLLEKGVRLVLGHAWSVTVTGAAVLMTEVYRQLLEEEDIITDK